jgi:hypothetical protein
MIAARHYFSVQAGLGRQRRSSFPSKRLEIGEALGVAG